MGVFENAMEAIASIQSKTTSQPLFCISLGTGLSDVISDEIEIEASIPYVDIPHFPSVTVHSHRGQLIFGKLEGTPVVFLSGRFHYYEGYTMQEVTFPIRVMKLMGIDNFLFTNVAGSVNPSYLVGDIVFVQDHIYMMPDNPLRGYNDERLGPRFPDMSEVYNKDVIHMASQFCIQKSIRAHKGIYYCLQGPNLETSAEYEFIYRSGADLVGMSTIPEVIVAKHMGAQVNAISIVSNVCYPKESISKTTIEEVIKVAHGALPSLAATIKEIVIQ